FMDGTVLQAVQAANPDVLLIPENSDPRSYAYSAPYAEIRGGYKVPPPMPTATYGTGAFNVVNAADGDIVSHQADLASALRAGDILLFHAWFDDPNNVYIKQAYLNIRPPVGGSPTSAPATSSPAASAYSPFGSTLIGSGANDLNAILQ